ncbi:MAG: pyridoxamine 5'-phosphate oxidase family protein [Candidatus Levybacteria bacterium]|nr:pyridoxamine 5'-phosphate oxidase family protein [Candidatus Levybacteria bacterium]
MKDLVEKAKQILAENIYCTIATSSLTGTPWISPVFFGYDEDFNIYWISDKDAKHSRLIRQNPHVAIVIFNSQAPEGKGDGVYIEADVYELASKDEVKKGVKIRDSRAKIKKFRVQKIEEVMNDSAWRVYKAVPKTISKLTKGEYVNGQYVDKRIEIPLK